MVKSLIGKADGVLVNAAFKEAASQIPLNMSGIMATMTETQKQLDKQFVDMTTELFGNINSANEEMQELVDPIYKSLQSGTFTDADVLSFKPVVDGFKDEWKLIPKGKEGDEARLLWKNKVNKFKNTIASFDQKLLELTTNVAGENYLPAGLQGIGGRDADKNLKFLSSIYRLKSGKEGNKATMTVDEKGEVFFSANIDGEEIKMSMQEIEDLMPTKDMNLVKNVDALLMNYKKSGATKGSVYDAAGLSDKVFNLLNTAKVPRNAFQTLAHYDYGRGSFFQDLYSPSGPMGKTISEAIKGVQYSADVKDKFDTDGVPGISAGDFTNENRKAIADYIMSNDKIGRRVLSNWFAATEGQSAFNDGRNLIPKGGSGTGTGTKTNPYNLPNKIRMGPVRNNGYQQTESIQQVTTWIDNLKSGKKINYQGNEYTYKLLDMATPQDIMEKYPNGYWIMNDGIKGKQSRIIGTPDNMRDDVFQTDLPAFDNIVTEYEGERIDHNTGETTKTKTKTREQTLHAKLFTKLDKDADDKVSIDLNETFGLGPRSELNFMPYASKVFAPEFLLKDGGTVQQIISGIYQSRGGASETDITKADAKRTNDIMLFNPRTGEVVKDANGNRKRFKIGQDMDNLDSDGLSSNITELLKTLEEYNIEIPSSLYEETSTSTDGSINTSGY